MNQDTLAEFVAATATEFDIPGVAVGVWAEGRETIATHGVTSVENPLPVDPDTLFVIGSISKTFTATAVMRLVADGRIELDAPVRRYLPELRLSDERMAAEITVLNLLNHTAGLDWGLQLDTGEGDDALATYVSHMPDVAIILPPGTRASYSQAGFDLAGRIVEKLTGLPFERAVASLLLEPLGMRHSFYLHDEVMSRRFAVGHNRADDGTYALARLRRRPRGDNPGGGLASSASDLLRWARFHLGDGHAESGDWLLPAELLGRMQRPTVELRGSNLGDAIGICWFLRDVDGVRTVGHGGSTNGQFAELLLIPDRDFAVVSLANAGPGGIPFNQATVRWALESCLGLREREAEPLPYDTVSAGEIVGRYRNDVMTLEIEDASRTLRMVLHLTPEAREAYTDAPPDPAPAPFGLLPGGRDEYLITAGEFSGQRGFFTRDEHGAVVGVDMAGRLFGRERAPA